MINQGPTISTEEERIQMVGQNKFVDEVYPHAPWIVDEGTPLPI
jgi:glycerol-3-phosphate cytidylyltransferase-like family protein